MSRTDQHTISAYRQPLAQQASYIPAATLTHNGKIAVPDKDPKSWRSRGRKRKSAAALAVPNHHRGRQPAEIKRDKRIRRLREMTE